jgi:hypothetical protein
MRTPNLHRLSIPDPSFPLLESADLPGAEDWSVLETLRHDGAGDSDDDRFEAVTVARAFAD